ncbi:MAG TPA: hypothetical protein VFZ56_00905 [Gemmatimonadaceae bacterium]
MRRALRVVPALIVTVAALLAMAWGSTAPLRVATADDAILRVSLGARPERIEVCREQSDEELARLAPQMRQRVICEGRTAQYRLQVHRNGQLIHSQIVRGGGLRQDRQLYVSRDLQVPPGAGSFAVHLARIDTVAQIEDARDDDDDEDDAAPGEAIIPGRAAREVDERRRRREEAVPATLGLDISVTLAPRDVLLVSYDAEGRRLIARRADGSPQPP